MPTLTELQRNQSLLARPAKLPVAFSDEEMVADSRATLTPSQLVDRKLAERNFNVVGHFAASAVRPRAK